MTARSVEACSEKLASLWGQVVINDKYSCAKCAKKSGGKKKYMAQTFSQFAVCILDDHRTTSQFYVVSRKDLYDQHRAVEGNTTKNLNPVIYY